ncbi:MAG TPA: SOS response-associated peptidase [Candidatus Binatia bacterium]
MCGRFSRTSGREVLAEEFGVVRFADVDFRPRYNIAPSQTVEAILRDGVEKRLELMRWGFTPSFAKEPKLAPINARAETVATSPMFRDAFGRRRCLIVADGFYEWRKDERRKTPHFIHLRSGRPFGFAAIWSSHPAAAGTQLATGAILTCAPNELMVPIHNRMPVILPAAARDRWLDPSAGEDDLRALLVPLPSEELEAYEVSTFVNSPRNDAPECVRRVPS